ncbi:MAG: AAA family ATPase [Opitutales bacterium]
MTTATPLPDQADLDRAAHDLQQLRAAINGIIFGQEALVDLVITALLARGHVLLEGLPGLGKTELVKAFAGALGLQSGRVQFTPDLLPGDITGNPLLQERDGERRFVFQPGPIFVNLLLADEINRASPKTQSALLEAMQERQVTVMGEAHTLPEPFFVFATQNPIELEGTYPLPEAQIDRFLFKLDVTRTSTGVLERIIAERRLGEAPTITPVLTREQLLRYLSMVQAIYLPPAVSNFIARLVNATHPGESKAASVVKYGASPRAAIGLAAAARARALLEGRPNASAEDVQAVAAPVLQHRVILTYQARMEGESPVGFVRKLLEAISPEGKELPRSLTAAKLE